MEKYDIFLSGGPACRPAYYLQKLELRKAAYPLDWQMCDLDTGIHLYKTKFKDFFEEYKDTGKVHKGIRTVIDTKNNITAMHHVKAEPEIEVAVKEFRDLMIRRYENLNESLKKANSVCILMNQNVVLEKIKNYLQEFSKIYPNKQITLINIRNRKNGKNKKVHELTSKLRICEYFVNDIHADGSDPQKNKLFWHGNEEAWENILKEYALND